MNATARILVADDEPDLIEDYHCALALPGTGDEDPRLVELQDELFGAQSPKSSLPNVELVSVNQGEAAVRSVVRSRDQGQPFSARSEEHTSELQSLMRISYAVFCLKKQKNSTPQHIFTRNIKHHNRRTT